MIRSACSKNTGNPATRTTASKILAPPSFFGVRLKSLRETYYPSLETAPERFVHGLYCLRQRTNVSSERQSAPAIRHHRTCSVWPEQEFWEIASEHGIPTDYFIILGFGDNEPNAYAAQYAELCGVSQKTATRSLLTVSLYVDCLPNWIILTVWLQVQFINDSN